MIYFPHYYRPGPAQLGISPAVRHTGLITAYSVRIVTCRSQRPQRCPMSQHGPPPGPPIPGAAPGDRNFPGHLNRQAPPDVSRDVPNAGTAPRSGRVADEAFVRALYAEHGG